jgi:hypothetical protein
MGGRRSFLGTGIESGDSQFQMNESKGIFESPDKVTPKLSPQKGWLLADVHGRQDRAPYPDLSFSSAYNDNSIIRSSS